jgi:hypothetical protein
MQAIVETLTAESRRATRLIVWTDCDREGENIADEVAHVCTLANDRLDVYRARFSEISANAVHTAMRHLVRIDRHQVDAVDARQELDLRIGVERGVRAYICVLFRCGVHTATNDISHLALWTTTAVQRPESQRSSDQLRLVSVSDTWLRRRTVQSKRGVCERTVLESIIGAHTEQHHYRIHMGQRAAVRSTGCRGTCMRVRR